jgi:hypothetical protein
LFDEEAEVYAPFVKDWVIEEFVPGRQENVIRTRPFSGSGVVR